MATSQPGGATQGWLAGAVSRPELPALGLVVFLALVPGLSFGLGFDFDFDFGFAGFSFGFSFSFGFGFSFSFSLYLWGCRWVLYRGRGLFPCFYDCRATEFSFFGFVYGQ
ncbi:MAG: hypothetical protein DRP01_03690 [Archaeoglobales archaeon]|nr:MAG: hypothetical protein DRP01_03690 [Archaeoglobales archaeon]